MTAPWVERPWLSFEEITDFTPGEDVIADAGAVADSAEQRILYDTAFALLPGPPTLAAEDFTAG